MSLVARQPFRFRQPSAIPGFGLAFGYTLVYLGLIVLLPLAALVLQGVQRRAWPASGRR